jgi:hypothetical protein
MFDDYEDNGQSWGWDGTFVSPDLSDYLNTVDLSQFTDGLSGIGDSGLDTINLESFGSTDPLRYFEGLPADPDAPVLDESESPFSELARGPNTSNPYTALGDLTEGEDAQLAADLRTEAESGNLFAIDADNAATDVEKANAPDNWDLQKTGPTSNSDFDEELGSGNAQKGTESEVPATKKATEAGGAKTAAGTGTGTGNKLIDTAKKLLTGTGAAGAGQSGLGSLLPLLLMMFAANKSGSSNAPAASSAGIPALTTTQMQTPYSAQMQAPGYRQGQGGISYFNPVQYAPRMAAGGIANLRAPKGRLLDGAGDGVSDSIPATIGKTQPARLARGEFVVDARSVAELGNGSTQAGSEKLEKMLERLHQARKKVGRGQDSHPDRYLPA